MVRSLGGVLTLALICIPGVARGRECTSLYSGLGATARLRAVRDFFPDNGEVGLVNETGGSFVTMGSRDDRLYMIFYTSGLFDLYPVKREGPLEFCDDGVQLRMIGLGHDEELRISERRMNVGKGGPKLNFTVGQMPEPLRKMHKMEIRGLASKPN